MIRIIVLAFLIQMQAAGQSAAELLQKAIYAQESVGDFDSAIRIYRQLAGTPYAAQAQYRLALCLAEKGAKADAAMALSKFLEDYPDQKDLAAKARESLRGLAGFLPTQYRDPVTGFSFTAPHSEWFEYTEKRWNDGSVTVNFSQTGPWATASVYVKSRKLPAAELVQHLRENLNHRVDFGAKSEREYGYLVRPETLSLRQVGRFQVLSCVLDFNPKVRAMDYIIWVASEQTEACFEVHPTTDEYLDRVRHDFDQLVETVKMP